MKNLSLQNKLLIIFVFIIIFIIVYIIIRPSNTVERATELIINKPSKVFRDAGMETTDIECRLINDEHHYKCIFGVYNDGELITYKYDVYLNGFKSEYHLVEE